MKASPTTTSTEGSTRVSAVLVAPVTWAASRVAPPRPAGPLITWTVVVGSFSTLAGALPTLPMVKPRFLNSSAVRAARPDLAVAL